MKKLYICLLLTVCLVFNVSPASIDTVAQKGNKCFAGNIKTARADTRDFKAIAAKVMKDSKILLNGTHSGTPYNDFVEYLPQMSYVEGETAGFDTFYPVSCAGKWPGSDEVITVNCCSRPDYDVANGGTRGDRIILGTQKHGAFFLKGSDNTDDEYCHITNFDYGYGFIQLFGDKTMYYLEHCLSKTDGTKWDGWALFLVTDADVDMIAFIDDCNKTYKTNSKSTEKLDLGNPVQFQYAKPIDSNVEFKDGTEQIGTIANDSAVAVAADKQGNSYLAGHSEGEINPGDGLLKEGNKVWVASFDSSGKRRWLATFQMGPGASAWDMTTDDKYLYVVGRDWRGSSARFDAFILKLDCTNGKLTAKDIYTSTELDGYGNVAMANGMLYVSGQGGVKNGYDYLVAAHKTSDLKNVWRKFYNPFPKSNTNAAEAWGGIDIFPSSNLVFTSGWWFNKSNGMDTNGWACAFKADTGVIAWSSHADIDSPTPRCTEWSLGSAADSKGNYYVAGYTTGNLGSSHKGQGDLFVRKYTPKGKAVWTKQWGTGFTDSFRRLVIDENDILYAVGFTYGDLAGKNRDKSHRTADIYIARMDTDGKVLAEKQFGTEEEDRGFGHVENSILYLAGTTEGSMTGLNQGACDAFILLLDSDTLETAVQKNGNP